MAAGLLNARFGNAPDVIMAFIALFNDLEVVAIISLLGICIMKNELLAEFLVVDMHQPLLQELVTCRSLLPAGRLGNGQNSPVPPWHNIDFVLSHFMWAAS